MKYNWYFLRMLALGILALLPMSVQAQWQTVQSNAGNSHMVATHGSRIYNAAYSGLYVSTDQGQSWTMVREGLCAAVASSGSTLYASFSKATYRSADNGLHWDSIGVSCYAMAAVDDIVICLSNTSVLRSTNRGTNWTSVSAFFGSQTMSYVAVQSGTFFAGGSDRHIYRSSDKGASWEASLIVLDNVCTSICDYASKLIAATRSGIYISSDGGIDWTSVESATKPNSISAIHSVQSTLVATTLGQGAHTSVDGGKTWQSFSEGIGTWELFIWDMAQGSTHLVCGTESGHILRRPISEVPATIPESVEYLREPLRSLQLYPQPAMNFLHLDFQSTSDGSALVRFIDLRGEIAFEQSIILQSGANHFDLDLKDLQNGVFSVQVVQLGTVQKLSGMVSVYR